MPQNLSLPLRFGFVVLSALAYAASFPPLGWRWLVVPAVAGFLVSLRGLRGSRARAVGFFLGMVAFAAGIPWLALLFGVFAVALWGILAAFMAAFAWMQSLADERGWKGFGLVGFTLVNWAGWEFIRAEIFPLKFPWMTVGLAWGPNALLPWVGVYASGLVLVFLALCLVRKRWWQAGITAGFIFVLTVGTGVKDESFDPSHDVAVAGLQFESVSADLFFKETRVLPRTIGSPPARIQHVVWPEYAIPYDVRANRRDWTAMQELCLQQDITLTLGTQTHPKGKEEWFNTALTLNASGTLGEHYKVHTVHFFNDGTPGTTTLPVKTEHGVIGTPICFDCDYEGVIRRMTAAGAEAFIIPMMDAESWSRMQHVQHAELFRMRACENGRELFVCGTSGVSQIIGSHGQVKAALGAMEQGVLTGIVRRHSELTFYTRWGWLTPWILMAVAVVCWIVLLLPHRAAKDALS